MKFKLNKKYIKILLLISIPILIALQYYFFKLGVIHPIVKGIEIQISEGRHIEEIDHYIIQLHDEVTLSSGDYIYLPTYAKKPTIHFQILSESVLLEKSKEVDVINQIEENSIVEIEGNKMIAKQEGIATVGVMKGTRVLKKANVKVVDPKVDELYVEPINTLNYVGDTAKIQTHYNVDYNEFKSSIEPSYKSSDESIIKVKGDTLEAVGVGKATVSIKVKDEEYKETFNISTKVSKINIESIIEIEQGQSKKLNPEITTNPKGLKHPNITYTLVENKLPIERAIRLDKNGNIEGIRIGQEKVKITCGQQEKIITINVVKDSLTNNKIENLKVDDYEIVDGKLQISLSWDYIKKIYEYEIYMKNNSLSQNDFSVFKSIKVDENNISDNRVRTIIELDLIDGKIPDLSIYVVGKTKYGSTNMSNIVFVKPPKDIDELEVKGLYKVIDTENRRVQLTWLPIELEGIEYSIYVKNNSLGENGFKIYDSNIFTNSYVMTFDENEIDLDIYVRANAGDKLSKSSNLVNVKIPSSNENEGEDGNDGNEGGDGNNEGEDGNNGEDNDNEQENTESE